VYAAACLTALLLATEASYAATPQPLRVPHAAVASDHAAASAAGVELLRAGGNAVDAACATALALGVTIPHASGIGGGGFAVVYLAREHKVVTLDFREKAPAAIKPELYFREGKPDSRLSVRGGLAVAVPGEVRGLSELVRRWGKLPFSACVRPAERLARAGVPLTERAAEAANAAGSREDDGPDFVSRVFTVARPFALPLRPGEVVRRPALASTLGRLRRGGADAFYKGPVAEAIVAATRAAGGVLTREDLQGYQVVERAPLETTYRGRRVFSMPPPSSGGIAMSETLGILSNRLKDPPRGKGRFESAYLHVLAEALKHAFADRARHLGDPDFVTVPVARLLDPAYHRELAARIDDRHVLPAERYGFIAEPGPAHPPRDGGTTHLSIIDADGNAVALTTTVNLGFGAHVIAGDTGIVLNDQMDDFTLAPNTPNAFGLVGTDRNFVAPGKRPLSSMTPTVVLAGAGASERVLLAAGGAGGPTIISGTLQLLLNVVDGGLDAQAASASPRIHHQWAPDLLVLEPDFPRDVVAALERRGHKTGVREHICTANIVVKTDTGVEAATELRSGGAPAGY
jgi:gamma-glutamyltranspeptidase/glutathione hydrolase